METARRLKSRLICPKWGKRVAPVHVPGVALETVSATLDSPIHLCSFLLLPSFHQIRQDSLCSLIVTTQHFSLCSLAQPGLNEKSEAGSSYIFTDEAYDLYPMYIRGESPRKTNAVVNRQDFAISKKKQ